MYLAEYPAGSAPGTTKLRLRLRVGFLVLQQWLKGFFTGNEHALRVRAWIKHTFIHQKRFIV